MTTRGDHGATGVIALRAPAAAHAARRFPREAPAVVSSNGYMRRALPAIYQGGELTMRFVGALEEVLDPVIAVLDSLEHHFDPDLAPPDLLEFLAAWLGIELDESWPEERRREIVRRAGELHRMRGTRGGLELALAIAFPELPLRIEDAGGVSLSAAPDDAAAPDEAAPGFVVYCDVPITEPTPALLARTIERLKPVDVTYRLRIRAGGGGAA
jgi:phage tail-like protein